MTEINIGELLLKSDTSTHSSQLDELHRMLQEKILPVLPYRYTQIFTFEETEDTISKPPGSREQLLRALMKKDKKSMEPASLYTELSDLQTLVECLHQSVKTSQLLSVNDAGYEATHFGTSGQLNPHAPVLATWLEFGKEIFGIWILYFANEQNIISPVPSNWKELVRQITQVANQSIQKRNQLSATQAALGNRMYRSGIARSENESELLFKLHAEASSLVRHDGIDIILINQQEQDYFNLAHGLNTLPGDQVNVFGFAARCYPCRNSFVEEMMNKLEREDSPFIDSYHQRRLSLADPRFAEMIDKSYEEGLISPIRSGNNNLGLLMIHSAQSGKFQEIHFEIIRLLSEQASIAITHILAKQKLVKSEQEKSILLRISEDIANVRFSNDLLKVIIDRIKPLYGFYDCGILVVEEAEDYYYDLTVIDPSIDQSEVNYNLHKEGFYQGATTIAYRGSAVESIIQRLQSTGEPVAFSFAQDLEQFTDAPLLKTLRQHGYRKSLVGHLKTGGSSIGFFSINYPYDRKFAIEEINLFKNLVNQISTAVTNIISTREILKRDQEKSTLLNIIEETASARNGLELLSMIRKKVQKLIPFYDTGIIIVEPGGQYHYHMAASYPGWDKPGNKTQPTPSEMAKVTHPGSYVEFAMEQMNRNKQPIIENYEERFRQYNHPYFPIMELMGYKESMATLLKTGGKTIGSLWLNSLHHHHFKRNQFPLFQALADQLAVAVANILVNDQLESMVEEMRTEKKKVEKLNNILEAQNTYLIEEAEQHYNYGDIIGKSHSLKKCLNKLTLVTHTDTTVLVLGETGTGKELIARALHNNSDRKNKLMVKINCAALPPQLVESELFGHEKGAFTGAIERRIGKFELAHGSTIFLDEIGELSLDLQAKLLRVLQEKEIERLGGNRSIKVDARVVVATNRDLEKEVAAGRFRQDLFYRLSVFPIHLPPLRERTEDIPLLAKHFLQKFAKKTGRQLSGFSREAMHSLIQYPWPGNVRELEHLVERQVILSQSSNITDVQLPKIMLESKQEDDINLVTRTLEEQERQYILKVLKQCNGKISGIGGAAQTLGIPYSTLQSKMKKLGIRKEHRIKM